MAPPKLFAEKGALGSGDAKAALAIVRNVVAALVHSGAVKPQVIDAALADAESEIGFYNNPTDNEARRLIVEFKASLAP